MVLTESERSLVRTARALGEREALDRMLLCGRYQFACDHLARGGRS
jgi:hypothetical protein